MTEQRRQILEILADGKITVAEAERLIDALGRARPESPPGTASGPKPRPRYLRVLVSWTDDSGGDGPGRINVRVPLQLLRAGVRLTSLIPPKALARANAELDRSGVPIDLTQLKPQQLEELIDQLDDVTVDVDDPDAKVQIFCE
ncbi:SHOCT-like domain-containing protein [Actinomadura sp. 9N215]|uniref:SHOCT-like domain-containing protein n=1 Tax=Actinomadura sp. 9N215 TaxID=3375150 RepID=UPI003797A5EA